MPEQLRVPSVRVNGEVFAPKHYPVCKALHDVDPPPQPDPVPSAAWRYPRDEIRNLEVRIHELGEQLDADSARPPTLEFVEVLNRLGLRQHDIDGEGESGRGPVERAVLGALVELYWGVPCSVLLRNTRPPRRGPREAVFASLRSMLTWYQTAVVPLLGMGEARLEVAEDRPQDKRARARLERTGRALPVSADGIRARGWLPVEWMPAKQSRGGCLGGTKGLSARELKADIRSAIDAAHGIDSDTWAALLAVDVGEWQECSSGEKPRRGSELVRVRIGEYARRLPGGDERGAAHRLSHRLKRARWLLTKTAAERGLVPIRALRQAAEFLPDAPTYAPVTEADPWSAALAAGWE